MKFTAALAALMATTAMAAPAEASVKSMSASETWTFTGVKRTCDKPDNTCTWSFGIKTSAGTTGCGFTTKRSGNTPADQAPQKGANCGGFTVTSGWSGQFGAGKGFTTLSVVDNKARKIAYPAYTDRELTGGATVKPDRAYPVQKLN